MSKINSVKKFYLLILFICIISIISAVYIEHILEVRPCTLCLYQRVPYLVSIFICFFGYNYSKNLFWMYLLIIVFILSSLLSGYHAGIENNIFKEFSGCTNDNLNITNKSDLLRSLANSLPNCKDVNFKVFSLSLASINAIFSFVLFTIFIRLYKNYEVNR